VFRITTLHKSCIKGCERRRGEGGGGGGGRREDGERPIEQAMMKKNM
jgi:hypothetical protein